MFKEKKNDFEEQQTSIIKHDLGIGKPFDFELVIVFAEHSVFLSKIVVFIINYCNV